MISGGAVCCSCIQTRIQEGQCGVLVFTHLLHTFSYLKALLTHAHGVSFSYFISSTVPDGAIQNSQTNISGHVSSRFLTLPRMHHQCITLVLIGLAPLGTMCPSVITLRMLPEGFCEWKTEPEQQ